MAHRPNAPWGYAHCGPSSFDGAASTRVRSYLRSNGFCPSFVPHSLKVEPIRRAPVCSASNAGVPIRSVSRIIRSHRRLRLRQSRHMLDKHHYPGNASTVAPLQTAQKIYRKGFCLRVAPPTIASTGNVTVRANLSGHTVLPTLGAINPNRALLRGFRLLLSPASFLRDADALSRSRAMYCILVRVAFIRSLDFSVRSRKMQSHACFFLSFCDLHRNECGIDWIDVPRISICRGERPKDSLYARAHLLPGLRK